MWTKKEFLSLLPYITVKAHYKDENLQFYQLYPVFGYLLHIPGGDSKQINEEGNPILDENGNEIIIPYLSEGGATATKDYDFQLNSLGFEAILKEVN